MSLSEKDALIRKAVEKHFVEWAYLSNDECLLALGDKFCAAVERVRHARDKQVKVFEEYFEGLDLENLHAALGMQEVEGFGLRENEIAELRQTAIEELGPRSDFILIALGARPNEAADYKMWSLRDSYNAKEITWLSIGLEPSEDLDTGLDRFGTSACKIDPFVCKEAQKRLEIIYCSQKLGLFHNSARRTSGKKAWEWLKSIDLDTPSGFRTMLETSGRRVSGMASAYSQSGQVEKSDDAKVDPRVVRTTAKLIAAMAKDGYGWDHNDRRSPISGELESVCDRLGVPVSRETILKYLRMGASFFPEDD